MKLGWEYLELTTLLYVTLTFVLSEAENSAAGLCVEFACNWVSANM